MWRLFFTLSVSFWCFAPAQAYEHKQSLVQFLEYEEGVIEEAKREKKPYFLLFSAQWCHWCHEFAEHTLVRKDVANYLNDRFTNVFIDVDIHNAAYVKYRATGLPYTVFLNPDGSIYYKYTGTLYGDDFLDVIKQVARDAGPGQSAYGAEYTQVNYAPPELLTHADLADLPVTFYQGMAENFDPEEHGLGMGQKSILPRTFLYLLQSAQSADRHDVIDAIGRTLGQAIDTIYDPIEGGFFRYAETRDWKIPHYEKFADLNAGTILLLYQINELRPSPEFKRAADKTLEYLMTTLFDEDTGAFLSFQIADTRYYFLSRESRETAGKPKVMDKIFADRLAATVSNLLEVLDYANISDLNKKIMRSLDFLGEMIMRGEDMSRYYEISQRQWRGRAGLSDHAYIGSLFTKAAARFQNPQYASVALKVMRGALDEFYDEKSRVFLDPTVDTARSAEYLMEMNGILALTMMELGDVLAQNTNELVTPVLKYFSLMGEVLEDRLWDGVEWEFAETYVPYLTATERYLSTGTALQ